MPSRLPKIRRLRGACPSIWASHHIFAELFPQGPALGHSDTPGVSRLLSIWAITLMSPLWVQLDALFITSFWSTHRQVDTVEVIACHVNTELQATSELSGGGKLVHRACYVFAFDGETSDDPEVQSTLSSSSCLPVQRRNAWAVSTSGAKASPWELLSMGALWVLQNIPENKKSGWRHGLQHKSYASNIAKVSAFMDSHCILYKPITEL